MISVTELRNGTTFQVEGEPFVVLKYEHTKLGRGKANIRVKVRNLLTGRVLEKSFISGAKVEPIQTQKRKMQYLYQEGENFYFMDPASFEQIGLPADLLGEQAKFLKEGQTVGVLFWEPSTDSTGSPQTGSGRGGRPLSVELPTTMELVVRETEPGVKGDTTARSLKPATLENGIVVKVPFFIKVGDKIKVDTRTEEYIERTDESKKK